MRFQIRNTPVHLLIRFAGAHFSRANLVGCLINWADTLSAEMRGNFYQAQITMAQFSAIPMPLEEKMQRSFVIVDAPASEEQGL
jgi:hypothetical protein